MTNYSKFQEYIEIIYYVAFILTVFASLLIFMFKTVEVSYKKCYMVEEKFYEVPLWATCFTIIPLVPFLILYFMYSEKTISLDNWIIALIVLDFMTLISVNVIPFKKRNELIKFMDKDSEVDKFAQRYLKFVNSIYFAIFCVFIVGINIIFFIYNDFNSVPVKISMIVAVTVICIISFLSSEMFKDQIFSLKKVKTIILNKNSEIYSDDGTITGNILEYDENMVYIKTLDGEVKWVNKNDIAQIKIEHDYVSKESDKLSECKDLTEKQEKMIEKFEKLIEKFEDVIDEKLS